MTLTELLIVVMIMVILLGIALPAIKPALEDRKVREASRQFNAFIRAAQSRAVEKNNIAGIEIARTDNADATISYQVYFTESPPPYVGDISGAGLSGLSGIAPVAPVITTTPFYTAPPPAPGVRYRPEVVAVIPWANQLPTTPPLWLMRANLLNAFYLNISHSDLPGAVSDPFVKRGDTIRFNYSGPDYVIYDIFTDDSPLTSDNPSTPMTEPAQNGDLYEGPQPVAGQIIFGPAPTDLHALSAAPNSPSGPALPLGSTYQIFRQPQRSTAGALTLPNETAIDLSLSGGITAPEGAEFGTTTASIKVTFRPDGAVDRVFAGGIGVVPNGPLHFLIGSAIVDERNTAFATLSEQNLNNPSNLWVSINHRTGTITTTPNQDISLTTATTVPERILAARTFARAAQSVGGK
jgi:type II secretory pathway pseudopilin PulG